MKTEDEIIRRLAAAQEAMEAAEDCDEPEEAMRHFGRVQELTWVLEVGEAEETP